MVWRLPSDNAGWNAITAQTIPPELENFAIHAEPRHTRVHRSCCEVRTAPSAPCAEMFNASAKSAAPHASNPRTIAPNRGLAPTQSNSRGAKLPESAGPRVQAFASQTLAVSILADRRVLATTCGSCAAQPMPSTLRPEHITIGQRFQRMATQAEACRQKANECARLARHVADSYGRVLLKQTATLWRQIAQSMEAREEIERNRAVTADLFLSSQAPRAKLRADLSMTLASMRELGVRGLRISCRSPTCRHEIMFSADDYAGDTELLWFQARMICARCGSSRLDVQPN
jgi:hypothetical protein